MEINIEEERNAEACKVTLEINIGSINFFEKSTITIKQIGRQSTKLYSNDPLTKLIFPREVFRTLKMSLLIYRMMSKII